MKGNERSAAVGVLCLIADSVHFDWHESLKWTLVKHRRTVKQCKIRKRNATLHKFKLIDRSKYSTQSGHNQFGVYQKNCLN